MAIKLGKETVMCVATSFLHLSRSMLPGIQTGGIRLAVSRGRNCRIALSVHGTQMLGKGCHVGRHTAHQVACHTGRTRERVAWIERKRTRTAIKEIWVGLLLGTQQWRHEIRMVYEILVLLVLTTAATAGHPGRRI